MRDAFIFYRSFFDAGKCIEDEADRLMFFEAIINYALDGVEPELNGIISGMFSLIKPNIDANNKKYENGKKGGRPTKNFVKPTEPTEILHNVAAIYYRIRNEIWQGKISEYLNKNHKQSIDVILMQNNVNEEDVMQLMDNQYSTGYEFKDNNHLINAFKFCVKKSKDVKSKESKFLDLSKKDIFD